MAQLSSGALLFLRGDVRAAAETVGRSYTREQVCDGIRMVWSERPYFTPGFPLATPLEHAVRIASFDGPPTGTFPGVDADPIRSDTGELAWHRGQKGTGLVAIDTERTQGLVGFCAARKAKTRNLSAEVSTRFCAIVLGALDDRSIAKSGRLLLSAGSRVANTGMEWNEKRTSLGNWGGEPSMIEPVRGRLVLSGLEGARRVEAQPLDGAGRPLGPPVAAAPEGEGWSLPLGNPPAPWFVLTVTR